MARELWPRYLARDAQLRALSEELDRRRFELEAAQEERPGYLGVSHQAPDLETVDMEIENVRATYFPETGRCLPTGHGHRMVAETGHVGLLHVASHALVSGFEFGARTVTPMDLADMTLTADILLLTGCFLGAFGRADNNEFVSVARQLLIATGARAAVVSIAPVPQAAGNIFSDLVASALTARAPGKPWEAPAGPMAVGPAVAWARRTMRGMTKRHAALLLGDLALPGDNPRRDPWWTPWFVVGDPTTRIAFTSSSLRAGAGRSGPRTTIARTVGHSSLGR